MMLHSLRIKKRRAAFLKLLKLRQMIKLLMQLSEINLIQSWVWQKKVKDFSINRKKINKINQNKNPKLMTMVSKCRQMKLFEKEIL